MWEISLLKGALGGPRQNPRTTLATGAEELSCPKVGQEEKETKVPSGFSSWPGPCTPGRVGAGQLPAARRKGG